MGMYIKSQKFICREDVAGWRSQVTSHRLVKTVLRTECWVLKGRNRLQVAIWKRCVDRVRLGESTMERQEEEGKNSGVGKDLRI